MTINLVPLVVDADEPWRTTGDDARDGIGRPSTVPPVLALRALITAVKVAVAGIAILVVLPAAIAAQAAAAAR